MGSRFRLGRFLWRLLIRSLVVLILAILASVVYLETCGTPRWLLKEVLARANAKMDFVLEASRINVSLWRGVTLRDARLFRRKVVGPPAVEAAEIDLALDLKCLLDGWVCLQRATVRGGVVRPALLFPPPSAETGRAGPSRPVLNVDLELRDCLISGVGITSLTCVLAADGSILRLQNVRSTLSSEGWVGGVDGDAAYDMSARTLDVRADTLLDPHLLLPLMREYRLGFLAELTSRFELSRPPKCHVAFTYTFGGHGTLELESRFECRDGAYRGVSMARADGTVTVAWSETNRVVSVDPLFVARQEGTVKGGFTVDAQRRVVEFEGTSTVDPAALFDAIGVLTNVMRGVLRFGGPVRASGGGVVDYHTLAGTDLEANVRGRNVSLSGFEAEECSFTVAMAGSVVTLRDLRGRIFGGSFEGGVRFGLPAGEKTNTTYDIDVKLTDADFEKTADAVARRRLDKNFSGQLSGQVKLRGVLGEGASRTIVGQGAVEIKRGRVFMLPLFGGLSHFMTRLIPGLDFVLRQNDASATFTIADGKIHSDKVRVDGDVLSLDGHGDYGLDKTLDFNVQVTLMKEHTLVSKLVRLLIYPISKLFEFRVRGSVGDPHWYPVNFSGDLLDKLGLRSKDNAGEKDAAQPAP